MKLRSGKKTSSSPKKKTTITQTSSSPKKTTTITELEENLLLEIFVLLSFNSIFRLRCVSRLWASLLPDCRFMSKWSRINGSQYFPWLVYRMGFGISYLKSSVNSGLVSGNQHGFSFKFLNPNPDLENNKIDLLGGSNGLVLCCSSSKEYYVCNPLTKQWVPLPPTPIMSTTTTTIAAFTSESISSATCYKVVLIPGKKSWKLNIQVFSSDVGKWNVYQVSHPKPRGYFSDFKSLVVINGQVYWIDGKDILSYNLNNECSTQAGGQECSLINFPVFESEDYDDETNNFCLREYKGSLCFVAIATTPKYLFVSVLKEEWELLHEDIELLDLAAKMFRRYNKEEYEGLSEDGEESESNYCDRENGAIEDVKVIGFSPVDASIILFGYNDGVWAYNIENATSEELVEPLFMATTHSVGTRYCVRNSFALKAMPTVLPPPSWKNTPGSEITGPIGKECAKDC